MKHKNEGKTIALKARELFLRPRCSNNSQPLYCNGTQKPPYSTPFRILCKTISGILYTFTKKITFHVKQYIFLQLGKENHKLASMRVKSLAFIAGT